MDEEARAKLARLGGGILGAARNELYLHMRFLDIALSCFTYEMSRGTDTIGTDGFKICYNPNFLLDHYRQSRAYVNHAYLHMVLHCVFRHMLKRGDRDPALWNLACDIAMESVIDGMDEEIVRLPASMLRHGACEQMRAKLPVITAEGVYKALEGMTLSPQAVWKLAREFCVDDHSLWTSEDRQEERGKRLDEQWRQISEKMQTGMETFSKEYSQGNAGGVLEQVRVENRERYDYRKFLKKFAILREEVQVDADSFDYGFYTYGLELYGNMPLIEPLEYRETTKVEEFVIAIDTSMSCSGELVKTFLKETYAILKGSENFFKKVNIHIVQCDEKVQSDEKITCEQDLKAYMDRFELMGSGGTDFRPVFTYVDELVEAGEFRRLKGLLYFTDGFGVYPKRKPAYDAAFVFMRQDYSDVDVPPWAMKLILEPDDLKLAGQDNGGYSA